MRLRLTGEPDQRLRFGRIDVTKLLDLLPFTRRNVRKLLRSTQNANPTRPTRRRATLDRNRPLDSPRIDLSPVAGTIFGRPPGEILNVVHAILRALVILVI